MCGERKRRRQVKLISRTTTLKSVSPNVKRDADSLKKTIGNWYIGGTESWEGKSLYDDKLYELFSQ
jgi:hypothetical protein